MKLHIVFFMSITVKGVLLQHPLVECQAEENFNYGILPNINTLLKIIQKSKFKFNKLNLFKGLDKVSI